jgi:hypothetical protein
MTSPKVIIYYSRGKAVAYNILVSGAKKPQTPIGFTATETTFVRAYARFPSIRKLWNADGTPKK